ncbi:ABC transporter substrate-binding protein [Schumannella soli]|uniref:ABC transporter substrate-binding protein n=1 Tax=Schumannella soli TaxID=2590779 RepID=UPI0015E82EF3|nr:ABC transporter substrate-binding protein [Schumannella soli]
MTRRIRLAVAVAVGAALVLSACTGPQPKLVDGSVVRVAVDQPLDALNPRTSAARANSVDGAVAQLTQSGFGWWGDDGEWVADPAFGSVDVVAQQPFTVRWRVASGVTWSDGVPVDAADLLLAWAADSGRLTTPGLAVDDYVDPDTGLLTALPDSAVYFDGARTSGLEHSVGSPTVGDDGRSITVVFDRRVGNLPALIAPSVPAHIAAEVALDARHQRDGATAKKLVSDAVRRDQAATLAPLARTWNSAWAIAPGAELPDARLRVGSGPYELAALGADGSATLRARADYRGTRQPGVDELKLRVLTDPLSAVKAFRDGEVDVAAPEPSADVATLLRSDRDLDPRYGVRARVEHLELKQTGSKSGVFADVRVRRAFLATIPRAAIVEAMAGRVDPAATPLSSFVFRPGSPGLAAGEKATRLAARTKPDLASARRLLAQADVDAPAVCILFDPDRAPRRAAFELIRDSAAKAGFDVQDCSSTDWMSQLGTDGAYDAALFAWDTADLPPEDLAQPFRTASVSNFTGYSDAETDRLIGRIDTAADARDRDRLLAQLDGRIAADAWGAPFAAAPTLTLVGDGLGDVRASPMAGGVLATAWTWRPTASSSSSG